MQRYFRVRELTSTPQRKGRYPIARSTLWRWVARGEYPKPVQLSPGLAAWPVEVVEAWEAGLNSRAHNAMTAVASAR